MGLNCMCSELCFCYLAEGTMHNYNLHVHLTVTSLSSVDAKGSHPTLNDLGSAAFICGMFRANICISFFNLCRTVTFYMLIRKILVSIWTFGTSLRVRTTVSKDLIAVGKYFIIVGKDFMKHWPVVMWSVAYSYTSRKELHTNQQANTYTKKTRELISV